MTDAKLRSAIQRPDLPSSNEVLNALREAGWLLEQDTERALQSHGFNTVVGKAYADPDDPAVSREIDVFGHRQLYNDGDLSLDVGVTVIAECKQSTMPYVLVGRPQADSEKYRDRMEQQFRFPTVQTRQVPLPDGRKQIYSTHARRYLGLETLPGNPWGDSFLATQMTRLERKKTWVAENRGIFSSLIYPLAKALVSHRSQYNRTSYVMHRPGREWAQIVFYYPLVVTSAPIYALDASISPLAPQVVPWAAMTRRFKSKAVTGQFNVDVVTYEHLNSYLERRVTTFADAVSALVRQDPRRFITHEDLAYSEPEARPET